MGGVEKKAKETVSDVQSGVEQLGQNYGANIKRQITNTAYAVTSGDLTGMQNVALEQQTSMLTGGASNLARPGTFKTGKSGAERMKEKKTGDAANVVAAQAAADMQAEKDAKLTAINNVLMGSASSRRRTPGRAATMLSGGNSGPLLTNIGG